MAAKLAPLRQDPRYAALRAEFDTAAAIRDTSARKAALRAVIGKASVLRNVPAAATAGKLPPPPPPVRITLASRAVADAILGPDHVSIHPSVFSQPSGTKRNCGDSSDTFDFPGGDPYVSAISTRPCPATKTATW